MLSRFGEAPRITPAARGAGSIGKSGSNKVGKTVRSGPLQGGDAVAAVCAVVRRIPEGWVATYGQVAVMARLPRQARLVGHILQHLDPAIRIPWHRVVNAKGEVSFSPSRNGSDALQRRLLEREGVEFDASNRFDLERFRWLD